ncbi:hypothetical protein BROUX41_006587 [Berkeleyomyces rouxiae]|uniref:uncharacterized protein n=1 Tax=Berkeleyomyces rouxiae TaxID=2035830 RepID=UPI003B7C6086
MPPHLHPRSRMTSSLFAATVAASFLVVGLPHALPCPRTVTYADSGMPAGSSPSSSHTEFFYIDEQGRRHRRRRRDHPVSATSCAESKPRFEPVAIAAPASTRQTHNGMVQFVPTDGNSPATEKPRECPVPKPGGFIGDMLGFNKTSAETETRERGLRSQSNI